MPKTIPARWQSYGYLLVNVFCWGAAFVITKPAFAVTTPFRFLLYRYALAVFFSLPILWYYRSQLSKIWKKLPQIIGLELIGTTLALSLVYAGLNYTTALEANLLTTSLPLFITVGGVLILKEKEETHEWVGTLIAFAATLYLAIGPALQTAPSLRAISLIGNLLILGSNFSNLIYFPLSKRLYHSLPKLLVTTVSFYVGLVSFFLLSLFESGGSLPSLVNHIINDSNFTSVWVASVYMALFGSIIGLTAYIKGQDGIEASEAGLFGYLQPLIYIPLAFLVLGEKISLTQVLGLTVILIGVVIAEKRFSKRKKKKKSHIQRKKPALAKTVSKSRLARR
jgi:drug/metabolite transporter (DMT)-like permease